MSGQQFEHPNILNTAVRLIDHTLTNNSSIDSIIPILSLLCLMAVFTRTGQSSVSSSQPTATGNPLQKLLADLTKGEGGINPETIMSLLPLLNNPQVKSKLNPATLTTILGMFNNFNQTDNNDTSKNEKNIPEPPAAAVTLSSAKKNPSVN